MLLVVVARVAYIHAIILEVPLHLGGSSGKWPTEAEYAVSSIGLAVLAGVDISGSKLAHNTYAHKLGVKLSRASRFAVPRVGRRQRVSLC